MELSIALKKTLRPWKPLLRSVEGHSLAIIQWVLQYLRRLPVSSAFFGPPRGHYWATNDWFKTFAGEGATYQTIDPAEELTRKLIPRTIHDSIFRGFAMHDRMVRPEVFVASIPGGRFWGYYGGCIISPDDKVMADVSPDIRNIEMHTAFRQMKLPPLVEMSGTTCAVTTAEAEATYGHWLLEALPRFVFLQESGLAFDEIDRFIVNCGPPGSEIRRRQEETLALFGIPSEKVVLSHKRLHMRAEQLVYPSLATRSIRDINPAIVRRIGDAVPPATGVSSRGPRLYAARGGASFRRVTNEPEVLAALARRGFQRVELTGLSLREQAAIFRDAQVVAGVISSGLSNLVFSQPKTKLIEIFPDNFWHPYEWSLCDAAGLAYYYMFASGRQLDVPPDLYARYADCSVNITALNELLDLADL